MGSKRAKTLDRSGGDERSRTADLLVANEGNPLISAPEAVSRSRRNTWLTQTGLLAGARARISLNVLAENPERSGASVGEKPTWTRGNVLPEIFG